MTIHTGIITIMDIGIITEGIGHTGTASIFSLRSIKTGRAYAKGGCMGRWRIDRVRVDHLSCRVPERRIFQQERTDD